MALNEDGGALNEWFKKNHQLQRTDSDCGQTALAMLLGIDREKVLAQFSSMGMDWKHGNKKLGKKRFSTNGADLEAVSSELGAPLIRKRFQSWESLKKPAVLRVNKDARGNWHWVTAFPNDRFGALILDPSFCFLGILMNPPLDVYYFNPLIHTVPFGMLFEKKE